jgi:hypothetical protein
MRIISRDKADFFEIKAIRFGRDGDLQAKVRAKGDGFAGTCLDTWFDPVSVQQFLADLSALEQSRQGEASLVAAPRS